MEKIIILTIVAGAVILLVLQLVNFFRGKGSSCSGCGKEESGCAVGTCRDKSELS